MSKPVTATLLSTDPRLEALRLAVQAKMAYWTAVSALEKILVPGDEDTGMTDHQCDALEERLSDLAAGHPADEFDASLVTPSELQELLSEVL